MQQNDQEQQVQPALEVNHEQVQYNLGEALKQAHIERARFQDLANQYAAKWQESQAALARANKVIERYKTAEEDKDKPSKEKK